MVEVRVVLLDQVKLRVRLGEDCVDAIVPPPLDRLDPPGVSIGPRR